jgi:outer membrane protein insertion porin family
MKADNRGWTFWSPAQLDQEKLDTDRLAIESYYQDRGYVNAKVLAMEKQRVDDKKVNLLVKISEGEVFTVTNVDMSGVKSFNAGDLIPAFNLENGKIYSGKNLKEDIQVIKSYYGSRGYADVKVTPQIKNTGAGQISVTYAVEEGGIFKVNEVRFTGNTDTKDEVMRRELAIIPGETFNSTTVDLSERRLKGLGYFKDVNILPSDSGTPGFKDISINVAEQQTGQLNFGAGFSSIDNLVGFVDLRQSNFDIGSWPPVGAGQRFNMNLKIGTKRKDVTVGWYEPWLMGNPLGFGVEAFYNQKTYLSDVYDQTNMGADIYFRKRLAEGQDLRLQLLSENVTIDGIDAKASPEIKKEAGDYFHNELTLTFNHDTRDDVTTPRKGFKFQADLSEAFGDVQDTGLSLTFAKPIHLPLDMIFTVNGAYETVDGSNVPIFERTFLGGANNLRGFKYRDVGPKDATGEPLGGGSSWFLTTELTFPVIEHVRGAVFVDVGAVDKGSFSFGGGVNSDYGIGLRLDLPIFGPLKLDLGIPLQGDKFNDDGARVNISVDRKF